MNSVSRSVKREQSKEDSTTHGGDDDDDDDDEVHILIMREMQRSEIQLRLEVISSISCADPGEKINFDHTRVHAQTDKALDIETSAALHMSKSEVLPSSLKASISSTLPSSWCAVCGLYLLINCSWGKKGVLPQEK